MSFFKKNIPSLDNNLTQKTLIVFILRFLGIGLLFVTTLYITNNFSVDIVGKYDFVRTFLLVFGSLALLGTEHSILFFSGILISENNLSEIKIVYKKMISILFVGAIVVLLFFLIIKKNSINTFFEDNVYSTLLSSSAILFFYSISILNTEVLRAIKLVSLSEVFRNIVKYLPLLFGAVILNITNQHDLLIKVFLLGFVLIAIISTTILFLKFKKLTSTSRTNKTYSLKNVIKISYPMAISGMAFFLLQSFDIVLLKKFKGNETVAFYSVALKFVLILALIINTININVSSKIAELYSANKKKELSNLLKQSSRLMVLASIPITLIIILFNKYLLNLFGNEYVTSSNALIIMVVTQGGCTLFGSLAVYLNMTGKQKYFQNILIIAVIINLLLNWYLIPPYGMTGAAIAFSCSLLFWNVVSALVVYIKDKIIMLVH
ncbi:MATE family efflux transporter [Tenacibaculum sp. IB213877]|uniref:MATE family efflux transporter n=1 Tax=Tenacibaculum sp. IB213877 TaxID=3097351 RepID=UPI002A5AAD13|nr:MATE family efflux transporter [Tenacibaculum sp. IB213877]MDY0780407.1 MATE family efflux transporter [Tenacibaculum sp. IB213877]